MDLAEQIILLWKGNTLGDDKRMAKTRKIVEEALQAQHEATWAMAMRTILKEQQEHKDDMDLLEDIIVYHLNRCPPLQTTNDSPEELSRRKRCLEEMMDIEKELNLDD